MELIFDDQSKEGLMNDYSSNLGYWSPIWFKRIFFLPEQFWNWWAALPIYTRMPWSGDVTQAIRAWGMAMGQMVGQKGMINLNFQKSSSNPGAEAYVTEDIASYGRQLGRILDVLAPLVEQNKDALLNNAPEKQVTKKDLAEFQNMARNIKKAVTTMNASRIDVVRSDTAVTQRKQ